jgi:uncharacterized protein YrrD
MVGEEKAMSTTLRPARRLIGMPVFSAAEGKRLGEVAGLLVKQEERAVVALGIQRHLLHQLVYLPLDQFKTIGVDAVMVESETVLGRGLSHGEARALDSHLTGRPVLTESGERLGEVVGFQVEVTSGKICGFQARADKSLLSRLADLVRDGTFEVPDQSVVSLGSNALIVHDNVAATLHPPNHKEEKPK